MTREFQVWLEINEFQAFFEQLSPFAVEIRYPGDIVPVSREQGSAMLARLEDLVKEIMPLLIDKPPLK